MAGMKRYFILIAVIILVIVVILSSFLYLNSQKTYKGNIESITMAYVTDIAYTPIFVAQDQNYFAENGLNVTLKHYNSGADATKGLLNDEVDIAGASEFVLCAQALANSSLYTFGSFCRTNHFYLVARTDTGISSISDLKGKTLGVPLGTNAEFYLGLFLQKNDINLNQVNLHNIAPFAQTPNVLANGTVDAAVVFQPYINQINGLLGNQTVMWPIQGGQQAYIDAVCSRSFAQAHPELITRFLKALVQAEDFTNSNQDQAMSILNNALNFTSSNTAADWSNYQFSISLDQSQILAMQLEAQWLIGNNLTNATSIPNFLNYIYIDGLESVSPDSVNIIS
jgi:NitT/TauT family transport system substrate-binding protein